MSIESEISRIKNGVSDAYDAVEELGGDLPDEKTVDNLSDSIATISGSGSNDNMIINWDFRKPVNRNGKTSYTISTSSGDNYESSIDRWAISGTGSLVVADDSIIIARIGNLILKQVFDNQQPLAGYDVTVSFLVSGNVKIVLKIDDTYPKNVYYNDESVGIVTFTHTFPDEFSSFWLMIQPQSDDPVTLYGCKMEIGTKQTLAKQDENGDWKIIDPPDYDLQYALCCQYSQIDGSFVGNGNKLSGKHDNLLDNACFLYPVNRNGKTSYASGTTIDRWLAYTYASATVNVDLTTDGLTIIRGGTGYSGISQPIVNVDWWNTSIAGNTVTTSILLSDGTLRSNSYIVPTIPTTKFVNLCAFPNGGVYLFSERIVVILTSGTSITIKAVKMELGSAQTLAERSNAVWNLIDIPTYPQEYLRTAVFSTNTYEFGGLRIPGQNILRNWDFRKPVNRNGLNEYTVDTGASSRYVIDNWQLAGGGKLQISDGRLTMKRSGTFLNLQQNINAGEAEKYGGETIIISMLMSGHANLVLGLNGTYPISIAGNSETPILVSRSYKLPEQITTDIALVVQPQNNDDVHVYGVKFEIGNQQTLAHVDADGNWILNDPIDYALQYSLCSQYSPINGTYVGIQYSNPNLLDNWYWIDPINQKGATSVNGGYGIDRWKGAYTIENGFIKIPSGGMNYIGQILEDYPLNVPMTFSALLNDGRLICGTKVLTDATSNVNFVTVVDESNNQLQLNRYSKTLGFMIWTSTDYEAEVVAVKLELGSVQTLARKEGDTWVLNDPPPNKQQELAKCQRYQQIFGSLNSYMMVGSGVAINDTTARIFIPTSVDLRGIPAIKCLKESDGYFAMIQDDVIAYQLKIDETSFSTPFGLHGSGVLIQVGIDTTEDRRITDGGPCMIGFCKSCLILDANL